MPTILRAPSLPVFAAAVLFALGGCCRNGFDATFRLVPGGDTLAAQSSITLVFTRDCRVAFSGPEATGNGTYSVNGDMITTRFKLGEQEGLAGTTWSFLREGDNLVFQHQALRVKFKKVAD